MKWHGRARISRSHPEASGLCDRCGTRFTRSDLRWQHDWNGPSLVNQMWLVCRECLDEPSPAFRTIFIPPDPVPVVDPRPVFWRIQEPTFLLTESAIQIVPETGNWLMVIENFTNTSAFLTIATEDGSNTVTDEFGNFFIDEQPYAAPI